MSSQLQTVVFLVRHGQTDRIYSRDPEVDGKRVLTEIGERQMKAVGEYLKSFDLSAIYSSPLHRTLHCSQIIKKEAEIKSEIIEEKSLHEVYTDQEYSSVEQILPDFFKRIVIEHSGRQVACVSHQYVIEGALRVLGVISSEAELPCDLADVYRLVFAGPVFVQCTKLHPASSA